MKSVLIGFIFSIVCTLVMAQTSTVSSGNWTDAAVWNAGVPGANTNTTVNSALILDQNITIGTGDYIFNQSVTDLSGGSNHTLTATTAGGVLDITAGTTTFGGAANISNMTLIVRSGATLILGGLTIGNGTTITIQANATLIVNGNVLNSNSGGTFSLNGLFQINGNYTTDNGNIDVLGTGNLYTTGSIETQGASSEIFGNSGDCATGPCSGRDLCTFPNTISATQTICSGSTPAGLTGNNPNTSVTGTYVYQWQSSASFGGTYTNITGATSQNYSPGSLTSTTYYRRRAEKTNNPNTCTSFSTPITISVGNTGSWIGTTSSAWETSANWCGGVPTAATNVTVLSTAPNMPQISSAAIANNVTINSGATLTVAGSNSISLTGNLTLDGTMVPNSGSLIFNGTTQTISGSTAALALHNLTNNASTSLTISSANLQLNLTGNLTNSSTLTLSNNNILQFNGTSQQTISSTSNITFQNLTFNNSAGVVTNRSLSVLSNLTMTNGNVDLSGNTITLGSSATANGNLSYANGLITNGTFTRWFRTAALADLNSRGFFPMGGTSANDTRSFYLSYPSGITTGGTVSVQHSDATDASDVSFADGASTILRRHDSSWSVSTGNGFSGTGISIRAGGTGYIVGDLANLRLTQSASAAPGTSIAATGTLANFLVGRSGLTSAQLSSSFYVGSVNPIISPLPIDLLFFIGRHEDGVNILKWRTAQEINFQKFEIERSATGRDFYPIGEVAGSGGDTKEARDYSFTDENPLNKKNYYRLKAIDLDGTFEYKRPIIMVSADNYKTIVVFPNPVNEQVVNVLCNFEPESTDKIVIIDNLGLVRGEYAPHSIESKLHLSLGKGTYLLRYITADDIYTVRFVVSQ